MAGFTKEIIIQTLLELLNEKPLAKITVKDIVERCGVNRNTFYYHFRDIPDVMYFALKREADRWRSEALWKGLCFWLNVWERTKKQSFISIGQQIRKSLQNTFVSWQSTLLPSMQGRTVILHRSHKKTRSSSYITKNV